ncbi:SPOR domain-containing protein [Bacteroidota bacterium]
MFKQIFLVSIFLCFTGVLFAQDWNEIYYLEDEAQYFIAEKEYAKAIDIYRKIVKEVPDHSMAKFKIGELYLLTDDQKNRAIEYLLEASENVSLDIDKKSIREKRAPAVTLLYLGKAYLIQNNIEDAITAYNKLKDLIGTEHELYPAALQGLKSCENASIALNKPLRVTKKNLGSPINNDDSNFGAVFSGDGKTIIYTSYTRNYIDNFYSENKNGVWSSPKKISEILSGKFYLKTVCLSYDGSELYLTTDDPENNNIFVCYKEGKEWLEAEKLPKTINGKKSNETHACISKDGNTLYFTSNREGGLGGMDIYKSLKDGKGNWGEAENLGPAINTEFDEKTPFVTLDDKYLFFSSEGHSSIGGFDIFYIDLDNKSTAINLGYPANTFGDDVFFVPDNSLSSGYISLYDNTSQGKNDIYYLSILPKINFTGIVKDKLTDIKISDVVTNVSLTETSSNNIIETFNINNGEFTFEEVPGNYSFVTNVEGYNPDTSEINIPENYAERSNSFEILLNPLVIEQEELIAEVIEQPEEEVIEEEPITKPEEEVITEPEEKVIEEKVEEVPVVTPVKEIVKYVPKTSSVSAGTLKTYSVQLMALKNPVEVDYFKNVENVVLTQYPDGFYRYTVGNTSSYSEAQEIKTKIHEIGYKDAFIRINEVNYSYTIQIMALIIPVKPDYFKDLSSVVVTKGTDDYFRYTIGSFDSYEDAKQELTNLKSLGYNQAFIKKVN